MNINRINIKKTFGGRKNEQGIFCCNVFRILRLRWIEAYQDEIRLCEIGTLGKIGLKVWNELRGRQIIHI